MDPLFPAAYDACSRLSPAGGIAVFALAALFLTALVVATPAGWAIRRRVWDTTLFTCPKCLGFWMGLLLSALFWGPTRATWGEAGILADGVLSLAVNYAAGEPLKRFIQSRRQPPTPSP
ncbi:MAG: hypothetical protein HY719_15170 [Planctomycetes bacterium]|nr:hypothetical protein [Planctomycetota bacterium]